MPRHVVSALLVVVLLAACAGADRGHHFTEAVEGYNQRVRWGDFAGALAFVHPDERPDAGRLGFLLERFEQVKVSGYAPVGRAPAPDENTVAIVMELRLVNRHTLRERVTEDRQVWRYDEDEKRWWLTSGLPDIGRE